MMQVSKDDGSLVARAFDHAGAAWSALWFRSAVKWEVERLADEGIARGTTCDVGFSVACDDEARDAVVRSLRAAGFTVVADGDARRFLTVSAPVAVRPYDLALAQARVRRVARRHGGYAELIGPLGTPAANAAPRAAMAPEPAPVAAEKRIALEPRPAA